MVYYYPNTSRISRIFLGNNLINKLIIIDYTTLVNITFDNELHLVAFPLVPLSDVTPRNAYVKQSLNLTLNVKALTIAGFFSPLITIVGVLAGVVSALGIVKYYTRTPVADILSFQKLKFLRIALLVPVLLVVLLPLYSLSLNVPPEFLHNFLVPFILVYLPYYAVGKTMILNTLQWRTLTVALMEAYDISIILWGLQWIINPFIAIFSQSLILAQSITLISISFAIIAIFYLVFSAFQVRARVVSMTTMLVILVPFLLNTEIVARKELCIMTTTTILKAKIYFENNNYVEGIIVKCFLDKIVIDNSRERRVISWGDVKQIELIKISRHDL